MKTRKSLFAVLLFFITTELFAATVTFSPNPETAGLNDIFSLDIIGTAFPDTEGGGVNFTFDNTVVNVLSISIDGGFWNFVNSTGTIDNPGENVNDILVSSFPAVSTSSFIVATVEFQAVGLGTTGLILTESSLNPWASGGNQINPDFVAGSITVTAVPLPAAIWLFSGALGCFGWLLRKNTITNKTT